MLNVQGGCFPLEVPLQEAEPQLQGCDTSCLLSEVTFVPRLWLTAPDTSPGSSVSISWALLSARGGHNEFFWLAAQLGAGHFSLSSSCPGAGGEERSLLPPDHTRREFLKDLVLWHPPDLPTGISGLPMSQTQFQHQEMDSAVQVSSGDFTSLQPNSDFHPEGI